MNLELFVIWKKQFARVILTNSELKLGSEHNTQKLVK
jgi:hypothetical protein